jgi:TonB family protein
MGNFPLDQEKPVRLATTARRIASLVLGLWLAMAVAAMLCSSPALAQEQSHEQPKSEELARKAKSRVAPIYPEVARRMSIAGIVRLAVVVAPNGSVKSSKPIGGHPLLVDAAMDAMKQWKFEPGPTESSGIVEFKFHP